MTENTRRSNRSNRRPPNYLSSEVSLLRLQESEGDTHTNMRHGGPKDVKHSASQLNVMAQLLAKFINHANAHYRQKRKAQQNQQSNSEQRQQIPRGLKLPKGEKGGTEASRKKGQDAKGIEEDSSKKTKQLYNFKSQHASLDPTKLPAGSITDKNRQMEASIATAQKNALNFGMSMQYLPFAGPANSGKPPIGGRVNTGVQGDKIMPGLQIGNSLLQQHQALYAQQMRAGQRVAGNPFESQMRQVGTQFANQLASDSKLFKRSSFHVAIAYHIHIKKLKAAGKELIDANDIDPTFKARRMREQKMKEANQEVPDNQNLPTASNEKHEQPSINPRQAHQNESKIDEQQINTEKTPQPERNQGQKVSGDL